MSNLPTVDRPSQPGRLAPFLRSTPVDGQCGDVTMPLASRDILVQNAMGLHARPAMQFVDLANSFASTIKVRRLADPAAEADGKSVMQMIILEASQGTPLRIEAEGDDADTAVKQLAELFESKFGED